MSPVEIPIISFTRHQFPPDVIRRDDQEVWEGTGGADENRTHDLVIANHALSQLSYSPITLIN